MNFVDRLPLEISHHIFSFLDDPSFRSASCVCGQWHQLSQDDSLMKKFYCENFFLGRDPEFYRKANFKQLKQASQNFISWIFKSYLISAENGVTFWGRSDAQTVWCSRKDNLKVLYKVNLQTREVLFAGSFSSDLTDAQINKRHIVVAADQVYRLNPQNIKDIECISYDSESTVLRMLRLYKDFILMGIDDIEYANAPQMSDAVSECLITHLKSKKCVAFRVKPIRVRDLVFLSEEHVALVPSGTLLPETRDRWDFADKKRIHRVKIFSIQKEKPVKTFDFLNSDVLCRLNDTEILMNSNRSVYDGCGWQGLKIKTAPKWAYADTVAISLVKNITHISPLSEKHIILIYKKTLENHYLLSLYSLNSKKVICENWITDITQLSTFSAKWGQISLESKNEVWVYDFAAPDQEQVRINL